MKRSEVLNRLRETERWDVLIIGGGATGLGVAVDAASRGYRTLLLEQHDFGKGTSTRSTKLIHGGVRYLAQGDLKLVRSALQGRGRLQQNAPHLVQNLRLVIPCYSWFQRWYYGLGLKVYDALAGRLGFGASRGWSRADMQAQFPNLDPEKLRGGVMYHDGQFDDARLLMHLLRTTIAQGGTVANYLKVKGLTKENHRAVGVEAEDVETGETFSLQADLLINATGPFGDAIRKMDDPEASPILQPSQGIHIVLDANFLSEDVALLIPKTDDGRVIFAIPWHGHLLVGTTDTPIAEPTLEPQPQDDEIAYLLDHIGRYLIRKPTRADVRSTFAGLRPLVKSGTGTNTAALSRDHTILIAPSGLVTITGGKWTTYRKMAEETLDRALATNHLPFKPCKTQTLPLHGQLANLANAPPHAQVYGADWATIQTLMTENPPWAEPLHPDLPYTAAEVIWAVRQEQARTVEDVLARRTRALFLNAAASREMAPQVAALMAQELDQNANWQTEQVNDFRACAASYG